MLKGEASASLGGRVDKRVEMKQNIYVLCTYTCISTCVCTYMYISIYLYIFIHIPISVWDTFGDYFSILFWEPKKENKSLNITSHYWEFWCFSWTHKVLAIYFSSGINNIDLLFNSSGDQMSNRDFWVKLRCQKCCVSF